MSNLALLMQHILKQLQNYIQSPENRPKMTMELLKYAHKVKKFI